MAINNNGTMYQQQHNFIDLNQLQGSGEVGRYKDEVTGILVGIEPRPGTYEVKDRRTGEVITRPNSWTAHFADGSMWSWPTWVDPQGRVQPWSRFDPSINLAACVAQQKVIHVWKDDRNFSHLEVVETQVQMNPNPMPIMQAQPATNEPPAIATNLAPWEVAI